MPLEHHPHFHVAIIGTGFGGIGAAVKLKEAGFDDLVIFERAGDIGGVWRDNTYPGAACDVQSHLYGFSFASNATWSRRFSPQAEIWTYLRDVAERFRVLPHIRFRHDVQEARWEHEHTRWRIRTSAGTYTADVLVAAPGALAEPRLPDIPGIESFAGPILHSARWDNDLDLFRKRVAVVGTGASAIQIVPAIQTIVEQLTLFQRSAPWVVPRRDRGFGKRTSRLLTRQPGLLRAIRTGLYHVREASGLLFRYPLLARLLENVARLHLRRQVRDPDLRRVLTPRYRFGCKRILLSDDYYPALVRQNVTVVDGPAVTISPAGVAGPDGIVHAADVLVLATGFHVTDVPFARHVRRDDGTRLSEVWGASPTAHLGTTVTGFPNFFLLMGPNTGLAHTSVILMIEAQIAHVLNALTWMRRNRLAAVEPRPEAQAAFVEEVDRAAEGTVWTTGGCDSWYLDATGRSGALWPRSVGAFRRRVSAFDPDEYILHPAGAGKHHLETPHA